MFDNQIKEFWPEVVSCDVIRFSERFALPNLHPSPSYMMNEWDPNAPGRNTVSVACEQWCRQIVECTYVDTISKYTNVLYLSGAHSFGDWPRRERSSSTRVCHRSWHFTQPRAIHNKYYARCECVLFFSLFRWQHSSIVAIATRVTDFEQNVRWINTTNNGRACCWAKWSQLHTTDDWRIPNYFKRMRF